MAVANWAARRSFARPEEKLPQAVVREVEVRLQTHGGAKLRHGRGGPAGLLQRHAGTVIAAVGGGSADQETCRIVGFATMDDGSSKTNGPRRLFA